MEDRVVVVALVHIGQEVLDRLGRLVGVEFEGDDAVVGDVQFDLGVANGMLLKKMNYGTSVADWMVTGVVGTFW